MNRLIRSLVATAVAGALCGVSFAQAGLSDNVRSAQRLDEGHWKYPHMHNALEHLREAHNELAQAEDVFKGQRDAALAQVDQAFSEVANGLKEQHDEAAQPSDLPPRSQLASFPHLHAALDRLHDARHELDAADKTFGSRRDRAMALTDRAIKQVEDGLRAAEK